MPKLLIKNLSKSFSDIKILDNINISVNEGEFVVLVGPSGSGKSTILRIIAGLENPTTGNIEINNTIVNDLHPNKRDIAMVFQNYALYPHMSVYENIAFPLQMKKVSLDSIKKSVNETASMLGLSKHLFKYPRELSGGERQRVALGRAVVRKPQLFLLDEPLSNLDAKLRIQMRAELLKLHKNLNATIVYVTHDQVEALTMGNKVIVLNNGQVQQADIPLNIYNNPENLFVAGFIGTPPMNLFDFKIMSDTKILFLGNVIEPESFKSIFDRFKSSDLVNQDLVMGVRPEDIKLSNNSDIQLSASVDLVEMLGSEYLIHGSERVTKHNFVFKLLNQCDLKPNDLIKVSIDSKIAHYFNKSTGNRIKS